MTLHADVARGRSIVARWCALAEQRLDYLTELFESGRWRRYHSERDFLENIQEAKAAVETWRDLLMREASLDNSAVDLSWLGRPRSTFPGSDRPRERPQPLPAQPLSSAAEPPPREIPQDVLATLESQLTAFTDAPSVADAPSLDEMPLPALDLNVMQERYPLLRNAL